jgi:hypothetical protein
MAVFGVSIFLGNMLSAASEGDFHAAFNIIHITSSCNSTVPRNGTIFILKKAGKSYCPTKPMDYP